MRQSELVELPRDCRLPPQGESGRARYRLKSKLIKGQGYDRAVWDEWIVAKQAYDAAEVARDIAGEDAGHLFPEGLDFDEWIKRLRRFTSGPEGARLGLTPTLAGGGLRATRKPAKPDSSQPADEAATCVRAAVLVGRWFAATDTATLFTLLGVRP
ncbi:three component ABC system middle component [Streptomyces cavourensis]